MGENEKATSFANKAIFAAHSINKKIEAITYYRIALSYHGISDYLRALENYDKALELFKETGNSHRVGGTYLSIGALYSSIPDYAKSIDAHQKAIEIFTALHEEASLSDCYFNIGEIYSGLNENIKALEYYQKALKIFEVNGPDLRGISVANNAIGSIYMILSNEDLIKIGVPPLEKYQLSLNFFNKALSIAITIKDNSLIASIYENIGKVYDKEGDEKQTILFYKKSLEVRKGEQNKIDLAGTYVTLGNFYLKRNDFVNSIMFLNQARILGRSAGAFGIRKDVFESLSKVYEKRNQYDSSLFFYRKFIDMRDSIFNEQKEKELTRKKLQMDFGIKENDYKMNQLLIQGRLNEQILLAKGQEQQIALNAQALKISDQEKNLQRLTFLQKQAELENDEKLQKNIALKQQFQSKYDKEIRDKKISQQGMELTYNKKINAFLLFLASIVLLAATIIFFSRRKTIKLNKVVLQQKGELEELVNMKDKMFSVISHDMRSPVNSLISFTNILEESNISKEKLALYASELKNNLNYTSGLLENLLKWSASQMQGFKPEFVNVDVSLIISEIVNSLSPDAMQKRITIKYINDHDLTIFCDKDMISLVLRNIATNALKYSYPDSCISLSHTSTKSMHCISIKNSGPGITPAKLQQINSVELHTIESTYGTKNEKGTGLGLLLSKTFISMMGGKIVAKSTEGEGCDFEIYLPVV